MANPTTSSKGNETRGAGSQGFDKAREAGAQAVDKAKEAASSVGEMVGNAAHTAAQAAGSAAQNVGRKADDMTSSAGSGIKQFGDTIREHGPQGGVLGQATKTVADTTKQVGKYLEEEGLSGMFEDVTKLIKRNPIPAILVGVGLGVLIGRVMRS